MSGSKRALNTGPWCARQGLAFLVAALSLLALVTPAHAADVALHADGWSTGTGSYTVPSDSNRLLIFVTGYENDSDPGITVSFGGQSMTQAISEMITGGGVWGRTAIFYLLDDDIPTGSQSFTVNNGGAYSAAHAYALFTNVDQTTPIVDTDSRSEVHGRGL